MEALTEAQIKRVVSQTLQELGHVSKIINRAEVISSYGRGVWDRAIKDLKVFKTGDAKSATTYLNRNEFLNWVDEKLLFKNEIKNLKR